ncbi:complement factor H-like [Thamnophis elegans]|uniref:complement factor H-like n=1 Tax=Thamnophis elegans TaxID=35005 RepID=UPI001378A3E3|nr:complement factor H-like [Thamnophis elegans]
MYNDKIEIICDEGFVPRGPKLSKCIARGWDPPPACIRKGCDFIRVENGGMQNYGKYPKREGEQVWFQCNNGFLPKIKEQTWQTVRCTNSRFEPEPKCFKTCEPRQRFYHGHFPYINRNIYIEGDNITFACDRGYSPANQQSIITCTKTGWSPPPNCIVPAPCSITRQQLATKNLFVFGSQRKARLLQSNQSLQFLCDEGYVLAVPSVRKCVDGYIELPLCISDPCVIPRTELESQKITEVENGTEVKNRTDVPENIFVQRGLSIELTCRTGYVLAENSSQSAFVMHCDGTPPVIPKCKEITCNSPRISDGSFRPQRTVYHDGDLIRIRCDSGFTFEPVNGEQVVECTKNGWSPSPKCLKKSCGPAPDIPNASLRQENREEYDSGTIINYTCNPGFEAKESAKKTCRRGEWLGAFTCKDIRCSSPPEIEHARITGERKAKYLTGEKVKYQCNPGYVLLGNSFITCSKEGWREIPRCTVTEGRCGRPPPVENGDVVDTPKLTYLNTESVTYQCQNFYTMQGSPRVTCQNGRWSQTPTCRVACTASEEDMRERNIKLRWSNRDTLYTTDGDVVEFVCLRGYRPHPSSGPFRIHCVEGKFDYPYCIRSN